jgi:hypothetical protein
VLGRRELVFGDCWAISKLDFHRAMTEGGDIRNGIVRYRKTSGTSWNTPGTYSAGEAGELCRSDHIDGFRGGGRIWGDGGGEEERRLDAELMAATRNAIERVESVEGGWKGDAREFWLQEVFWEPTAQHNGSPQELWDSRELHGEQRSLSGGAIPGCGCCGGRGSALSQ